MKKLLAMALALVMICSLFAVPAMAATIELDLVIDGTFEASTPGAAVGSKSATSYGLGPNGTAVTKAVNGSMVYAATAASNGRASYATNTISVAEGETFTLTFDVYTTSPNAEGGTTARLDINNAGIQHASTARTVIDLETGTDITETAIRTRVLFPINKWVRVTVPMTAPEANTAAYAELVLLGTTASAEVMYLDNVSLTKEVEGYNVNVTETNPGYGTVTAPSFTSDGSTTVTVTTKPGYFLYSATLDGTEIKDSFTKSYAGGDVATLKYTYTINGASVAADPNLVITYGKFATTELIPGGDMEGSTIPWYSNTTSADSVTKSSEQANGGTYSAKIESVAAGTPGADYSTARIRHANIGTTAGLHLVTWDLYIENPTTASNLVNMMNGSVLPSSSARKSDFSPATAGEWKTYSFYWNATTEGSDYSYFTLHAGRDADGIGTMYLDNVHVMAITETGATIPTYYSINVTEANDFGTVTAPAGVESGDTAAIKVVPNNGYYLASATLNGVDVTADFVESYENYNTASTYGYTPVWNYTGTISSNANFVITYGLYYEIPVYSVGGDAEMDLYTEENGNDSDFWAYSGAVVERTTADNNGGEYSFALTSGRLCGYERAFEAGEKYLVKFDAKAPTATDASTIRIHTINKLSGSSNGSLFPPVTTDWKSYTVYLDVQADDSADYIALRDPSVVTYIDNISVVKLSKEAPLPPAPETATVTIIGEDAFVSVADETVEIGETTTFTVAPMLGYYIDAITINGVPFPGFKAYEKDTYTTEAINEDTEIVVEVVSIDANDKGISTDVATLADVFTEATTAVTFGKVLDDEATEYGIYLTNEEGDVVTEKGTYGPYFAADAKTEDGQYAVEFVGLATGEYTATTYVMVDGTPVFGAPVTFVIE